MKKLQKSSLLIALLILSLAIYEYQSKNKVFDSTKVQTQKALFNKIVNHISDDDYYYLVSKTGFITFIKEKHHVTILYNKKIYQKDFDEIVKTSKSVLAKESNNIHSGKRYYEGNTFTRKKLAKKGE